MLSDTERAALVDGLVDAIHESKVRGELTPRQLTIAATACLPIIERLLAERDAGCDTCGRNSGHTAGNGSVHFSTTRGAEPMTDQNTPAITAHTAWLRERAQDADVVEAAAKAMDGPVLSWSLGDLKPGTAEQIVVAVLTALIGPKPEETK